MKKYAISLFIIGNILNSSYVLAEGSPIYYDTFYEDYYKAFPDAKPKKKTLTKKTTPPKTQVIQQPVYYNGVDPYMQYQTTAVVNQSSTPYTSFYQSVDHDPSKWEFDLKYKKGEGQFMFLLDVGSILNWDELQTNQTIFNVSRDFIFKNRQYVVSATYGTGSASSDRTSDDDVFNEAHIISLGKGKANLTDWSLSLGMRNVYNLAGFDITPVIGYKSKQQDFEMYDHTVPAPFYLEFFCNGVDETTGVCTGGIQLNDSTHKLTQNDVYYTDSNEQVSISDMTIPGQVQVDGYIYTNLEYGMQIYEEDFCYIAQSGREVCIIAGEQGANLLNAFGGVSSTFTTEGTTHIYNVTWEGPFIGVNMERAFSPREVVKIYGEFFKPSYSVWGNWPNRTDWAHDPSFVDDGGSAWGVSFDATYKYKIKNSIELTLGIFYEYLKEKNGDTTQYYADGSVEFYENALALARWKSYGLALGIAFKL